MTHKVCGRRVRLGMGSLLLLAPLVVLQLNTARPALAVDGVQQVRSDSTFDTNPFKAARADCPAGKVVLGGGGTINGGLGQILLVKSMSFFDGSAYIAVGKAAAPNTTVFWSVTAYAICAPTPVGYELITTQSFTTEMFQLGRADCSPGKRALSSGAFAIYSQGAVPGITLIRPDGYLTLGWAAARMVYPTQPPIRWQLQTMVICANGLPGQQSYAQVANAAGAYVLCPPGTQVYGIGGGSSLFDTGGYFLSSLQPSAAPPGASASMTGVPGGGGMVVQATCAT